MATTNKPPMFLSQSELIQTGKWYPPTLERLQEDMHHLWADVLHCRELGTPAEEQALRTAVVDLAAAVVALCNKWREQEIKRMVAQKQQKA